RRLRPTLPLRCRPARARALAGALRRRAEHHGDHAATVRGAAGALDWHDRRQLGCAVPIQAAVPQPSRAIASQAVARRIVAAGRYRAAPRRFLARHLGAHQIRRRQWVSAAGAGWPRTLLLLALPPDPTEFWLFAIRGSRNLERARGARLQGPTP